MEWSQLLKYALGFLTSFYGVYATLTDFKEEKDGKKRLSKRGYFGIGLLALTAIMGLGLDMYKDQQEQIEGARKTAEDSARRDEDIKRIGEITSNLTSVRNQLQGQSDQLGAQLKYSRDSSVKLDETQESLAKSFSLTNHVAVNLGAQLRLSRAMSGDLKGTADSLRDTSRKTDAILIEATESLSYIDIMIGIEIDPTKIRNEQGQPLVSAEVLKAYAERGPDKPISADVAEEAVRQLQSHYSLVRSKVLQDLICVSELDKKGEGDQGDDDRPKYLGKRLDMFGGSDRITSFIFTGDIGLDREGNENGVACVLTYRLSPNRLSGITKYKDLNGAEWVLLMKVNGDLISAKWAVLDVGQVDLENFKEVIGLSVKEFKDPKPRQIIGDFTEFFDSGTYAGTVTIPINYFK